MSFAERDSRTKKLTGRWAIDFYFKVPGEPDRRIRGAWATKAVADANEAYARVKGELPRDPDAPEPTGPTFAMAAEDMRSQHDTWKEGRDKSGQKRLDVIISRIGDIPVAKVSTEDLDGIVLYLKKRKVKNRRNDTGRLKGRTINGYLTMASGVLTWAAQRHKKYGKFVPPVVPWQDVIETRIHFMTMQDQNLIVRHYLEKGYHDEALVLRVFCASGMRWGEFEALEPC